MNRRSFLGLGAAAAATTVVKPTPREEALRHIDHIGIYEYQSSPEHRELADLVIARAGLTTSETRSITRVGDRWIITALNAQRCEVTVEVSA